MHKKAEREVSTAASPFATVSAAAFSAGTALGLALRETAQHSLEDRRANLRWQLAKLGNFDGHGIVLFAEHAGRRKPPVCHERRAEAMVHGASIPGS